MGKNIIVFTIKLEGHHLEYINHIYELAVRDNNNYFFLLPFTFDDYKKKFDWPKVPNVHIEMYNDTTVSEYKKTYWQQVSGSFHLCRILRHYAQLFKADILYTNTIIGMVPFAPLFFRKTKICGILYRIYLYEIAESSNRRLFFDKIKMLVLSKCSAFSRVFVLNDESSACQLNKIYKTDKFVVLPDPFLPIGDSDLDFRKEYNISYDKKLFVQFGALNEGKATIEILESLYDLSVDECEKFVFAFCGMVTPGIRERFYQLYEDLRKKIQIVVVDEFCDYELFGALCKACDAILTPYKRTSQSSGVVGYASQFHKPVIATNKGLLGKIVRNYKLGYLVDNLAPEDFHEAYINICMGNVNCPDNRYNEMNSINSFQTTLLDFFTH